MAAVLLLTIIAPMLVQAASHVNYCDETLCRDGNKHIGCNNSATFAPTCGYGTAEIKLTDELKQFLLDRHNFYRNMVASGGLEPQLPKAIRMAQMEWDEELAYLASLNSKSCDFKHDDCHNTKAYKHSGQNLYIRKSTSPSSDTKTFLERAMKKWFDEYVYVDSKIIDSYSKPEKLSKVMIGHFTVMVTDRATKIGCAVVRYPLSGRVAYFVTCNYASTNMRGRPVYKSGEVAGSGCTKGTDKKFKALCTPSEPIDPNRL